MTLGDGRYSSETTERMIAEIWSEVLGCDPKFGDLTFFEAGGHSLLASQAVARIREALGVDLTLRAMLDEPTVGGLARCIHDLSARTAPLAPGIRRKGQHRGVASFGQARLWFVDQLYPGNAAYNVPAAFRLVGALNVGALERALGRLVDRHEALRTSLFMVDGWPVQVVRESAGVVVERRTCGEDVVGEVLGAHACLPFDLGEGPLVRVLLADVGGGCWFLGLTFHHAVVDGWSLGVVFRELGECYAAEVEGRASRLPALEVQYLDWAEWQREWLSGEVLEGQLAYWREALAGMSGLLEMPCDHPRPAVQSFRAGTHRFDVPEDVVVELERIGQACGATLFMVLVAVYLVLVARSTGEEDVAVGTPVANRAQAAVEGVVGFFVNTLVLRTSVAGDPTFAEVVERVRETAVAAYAHQELPFERLVAELAPERALSHAPLVQTLVALQNAPAGELSLPAVAVQGWPIDSGATQFDLAWSFEKSERGLRGLVEYSADLFEPESVARLATQLLTLMAAVAGGDGGPISRLPLMGEVERAELLRVSRRAKSELEQIERIVASADGVRRAAVAVRPVGEHVRLVVRVESDGSGSEEAVMDYARERLPNHLLPDAIEIVDGLPRTSNDKVEKPGLAPGLADTAPVGELRGPGDAWEELVATEWRAVLGTDCGGIDDDFFECGGNSLLMLRLYGRLREHVAPPLTVVELYEERTIRRLAAIMRTRQSMAATRVKRHTGGEAAGEVGGM